MLPCVVLYFHVLSSSCLVWPCLAVSCLVLPCPALPVWSGLVLVLVLVLSCPVLSCKDKNKTRTGKRTRTRARTRPRKRARTRMRTRTKTRVKERELVLERELNQKNDQTRPDNMTMTGQDNRTQHKTRRDEAIFIKIQLKQDNKSCGAKQDCCGDSIRLNGTVSWYFGYFPTVVACRRRVSVLFLSCFVLFFVLFFFVKGIPQAEKEES